MADVNEKLLKQIAKKLEKLDPGTNEYNATLKNYTDLMSTIENTRNNTAKLDLENAKLEWEKTKEQLELNDRQNDRKHQSEQKDLDRKIEERRIALNLEAERFKAKHQFAGSLGAASLTAGATVLGICIANSAARKRTREVLYYEETGTISSNGGKNTLSNTLKPIKG